MKTCDISGMGGGYEEMCQRMLHRGIAYLGEQKPPVEMWAKARGVEGIYGVLLTEGEHLEALERFIIREGDDCTGAMHQAVMGHLAYIHRHGHEQWLAELAKHRDPSSFTDYVWDGR